MFHSRFLFGALEDPADGIRVTAGDLYRPDKAYGFVTEQNRREQEQLRIAELNSAFDTVYWYQDENLTQLQEDAHGVFLDSDAVITSLEDKTGEREQGEHRRIPLSFKMDVPHQGNYKVTVTICADEPMRDALIYTGRRRLGYRGDIPAGTFTHTMMVNVCDIVPRGHTERFADKTLDITVVADKPRISAMDVEEAECPTVYIAGDSTVTDQSADYPYAPGTSYSGWGQMISAYFNDGIAVSNHAHSGLTTESFREEGHYAIVEEYVRPGDFVFYQFAHNDQKLDALKARGGYHANLARYITECRDKGAYPLLVTPLARNTWKGNDGSYNDLLEEYAEVCKEIGEAMEVPVLDLHGLSMEFVVEHGLEGSKPYYFPGDYTHSNDYGAYYMAGLVAEEIACACAGHQEAKYAFLAECVTKGFGSWEPAGEIVPPVKPAIYENVANPDEGGALLSEVENLSGNADRASVLDMIIKTARFFPTNVYNDMFTDVVGHEWYAGTVECAYQNGIIDENLVEEQRFYPERDVTLEEFLVFAMNGYKSRKTLPEERACAYDDKCREFARPFVRAACAIGLIPTDGSVDLNKAITRGEAVEYCRKMKI
ncbi:MAG: GDSL-type esterase/lipase family protein [Eubacterium sp.]|nr:GDSL-type esterase/lipase family protein [Eubacterium sp.]MCM1216646.1 GDSL-type esterase/lipase family protein [Lachnospiraceae bacterium]MCM1240429.1 GDSL-type esterase/lipase family protein [Lachnospiraceae bacterium]